MSASSLGPRGAGEKGHCAFVLSGGGSLGAVQDGVLELAEIWMGLRRQDIFPLSPITGALGLLGRANHFISSDSLRLLLDTHIPFKRLEEARVPLHIVATELKSGRAAILTSGPAVPALLASCAIPGVFPPVTINRREYVDGGVANHTPVTVAIELGAANGRSVMPERAKRSLRLDPSAVRAA